LRPKIQHKELGGKSMSKFTTDCPHCRKLNVVEKSSASVSTYGYRIQCSHCSKHWDDSLGEDKSFFKSAPSGELSKLRENLAELGRVVDAYVARRAAPQPARFQPQGQETATVLKFVAGMPGGLMLEPNPADIAEAARQESAFVTKTASGEAAAQAELQKALANGRSVTSPNYTRLDDGLEKDAPSRFYTVESVTPGVQKFHNMPPDAARASAAAPVENRPFQPGRDTDLNKAHAAVREALANGKQADLADVNRRLTNPNTSGGLQDLARRIAAIYRQTTAAQGGVSVMSRQERMAVRDRIVSAMTQEVNSPFPNDGSQPASALVEIASLLAGLIDELEARN
jgi:hypothetical protein